MSENQEKLSTRIDNTLYNYPDISKKGSISAAAKIYKSIMEEGASAIEVAEMFKFVEEITKQLKELTDDNGKNSFTELVRDEIIRNSDDNKSATTKYGTKMELFEAATKYDYSTCNDPVWNRMNSDAKDLKFKITERESFLKGIRSETVIPAMVDPETFEVHENVKLYPPVKTSTSSYKQTLING